jgi:hypothetical protein
MLRSAFRSPLAQPMRRAQSLPSVLTRLGPELLVNGDFEAGQGPWSVSGADATHIVTFAGGTMRFQSGTTSPQLIVLQTGVTAGKVYEATLVVSAWTSGSVKTDSLGATGNSAIGSVGTFVRRGTAIGSTFAITRGGTNVDITFDSVSLREVIY